MLLTKELIEQQGFKVHTQDFSKNESSILHISNPPENCNVSLFKKEIDENNTYRLDWIQSENYMMLAKINQNENINIVFAGKVKTVKKFIKILNEKMELIAI